LKQLQNPHYTKLNALKRWIKNPGDGRPTCNFYALAEAADKASRGKIVSTHYLLTGYKYVIPAELNDDFLWHMAVSIEQGLLTSAVETRTDYFKYHLDLDFHQQERVTLEELKPYIQKLQEVLHKFFPFAENDFFECVICAAETKPVLALDGSTQLVKTGYHVFFPFLWVDKDQALDIRSDYLVYLAKAFGARKQPLKNSWSDVVDEHVYVTSGLRMLASIKAEQCKRCKAKRKKKKNREVPPKIPGLSVSKKQNTSAVMTAKTPPSTKPSLSLTELRQSLTSSRVIMPKTPPSNSKTAPAAPVGGDGDECPPGCEDGVIMEGRAYFLVAIWDFKGDDVNRMVKVRRVPTAEDTPRFIAPKKAFSGSGNMPFSGVIPADQAEIYWAMPIPNWAPNSSIDEDEEDFFDELGLEKMAIDEEEDDSADFVEVPLRELLLFGDPFDQIENGDESPWDIVRRLHNTLRLTSIRMPPNLQDALKNFYDQGGEDRFAEITKLCPAFVRPVGAVPYSRARDVVKKAGLPLVYDHRGRRVEHLSNVREALAVERGSKAYVNGEVVKEVEDFIRNNVGVRLDGQCPYAEIEVNDIIFNVTTKGRPNSYLVCVGGFGSGYCMNKNADHNSNNIYFVITKEGVSQRCHCKCHIDRADGECRNFKSRFYELPKSIMDKLFEHNSSSGSDYLPGRAPVGVDTNVAPRESILNFDPETLLRRLPSVIPPGCVPFDLYRKRKREHEFSLHGLEDPETRLKNIRRAQEEYAEIDI